MSVSWQDNDDALAELELLAQNQRKLNQLTQRMTGILSGFDRRLASLEGTLLPIHYRTQTLNRVEKSASFSRRGRPRRTWLLTLSSRT